MDRAGVKRVVITDQVLKNLALNDQLKTIIPMLREVASVRRECSKCRKRSRTLNDVGSEKLAEVKRRLYQSSDSVKQAVKNFLGADKLVFYFAGQPGFPQRAVV